MATLFDSASLVMIPSGVKEDKLYSIKPTDGSGDFTFSRDADIEATRVNSSGLIEKAKVNLALQSNTFSDGVWPLQSATITGGQSGYDGTSDAWLLNSSASGGNIRQGSSVSGVHTFSIYAKKGTADGIRVRFDQTTDTNVFIDLTDGSVYTSENTIDINIENVSGGWYRVTFAMLNAGMALFRIYPTDGTTNSIAGNIYIQDAQLNHGLIAQDYVETTTTAVVEGLTADLPRLDYSGGASCPSLLLEPSRTNLTLYSEHFADATWIKTNSTITSNSVVSPEGLQNAYTHTNTAANGVFLYQYPSGSATTATCSVFAKKGTNKYLGITMTYDSDTTKRYQVIFNLEDGTFAGQKDTASTLTDRDYDIEDYGNGWYRCSITSTAAASGRVYMVLQNSNIISSSFDAATLDWNDATIGSAYYYGAQLEAASYKTSYIPTYGTAANRGGDICTTSSVPSLIGQTEGTIFWQGEVNYGSIDAHAIVLSGSTSNFADAILLWRDVNGRLSIYIQIGGVPQFGVPLYYDDSASISANDKYAIGYAQNDLVVYKNGTQVMSASSGNVPATNFLLLNEWVNINGHKNNTKQALLFKTRLTNAELAALTTI